MTFRALRRASPFIGPLVILLIIAIQLYDLKFPSLAFSPRSHDGAQLSQDLLVPAGGAEKQDLSSAVPEQHVVDAPTAAVEIARPSTGRVVYSTSTFDKKYFPINFKYSHGAMNPNIIPHPSRPETWIIVAQRVLADGEFSIWCVELTCSAVFKNGSLECDEPNLILPIAATKGSNCHGEGMMGALGLSIGPHDARVFWGPEKPYTVYGSNSHLTCFGIWMQDFRPLVDWGTGVAADEDFRDAVELQRPGTYSPVEKNFFLFWDADGVAYVHHDIWPKRVFAKLSTDGSVGKDLAPHAATVDEGCMAKYMPKGSVNATIHQATNSLAITLCKRADTACDHAAKTFIFTIFQMKESVGIFQAAYKPYVMLFQQTAPFAVHGISQKPFWIHGRVEPSPAWEAGDHSGHEMIYVTSMSWKSHGQKYHGYMDDVLFLGFGIDDQRTAGIDIIAGDLVLDLGVCSGM